MCKAYPRLVKVHASWRRVSSMRALGHFLDDDGGTNPCAQHAFAAMAKAFFGNLTPELQRSSKAVKLRFLRSCVAAIPRFRWSRWLFTAALSEKLDACQRRFLYNLFPVRPRSDGSLDTFMRGGIVRPLTLQARPASGLNFGQPI